MAFPFSLKAIIAIVAITSLLGESDAHSDHRDLKRSSVNWTRDFVQKNGYPIETHLVTTDDGYILKVYRIPGSASGVQNGKPVLLHHGFIGCSADWVVLGPGKALGFLLADQGYDVWMANSRGSTESKSHIKLDSKDNAFWDFSWHEVGYYDVPAEIDYILNVTGRPSLSYVGYSMGSSAFWALAGTKPHYIKKVNSMYALGPVAFMQYVQGPVLKYIVPLISNVEWVMRHLGQGEFLPTNEFITWAAKKFCKDDTLSQKLCSNIFFLLYGFDSPKLNGTLVNKIFEFTPAGGSIKEIAHFAQLITKAPVFRRYDYGIIKNLFKYGQATPPAYKLQYVDCPVHVFMSNNDWFANKKDVFRLTSQLPNVQTINPVIRDTFNHYEFVYGEDAHILVYRDIIRLLKNSEFERQR